MPLPLALRLVDEAAELGVFGSLGFTGGEPMLFFEDLLQIGSRCKERGIPFSIATSGYWATTPQEANQRISLLARRGLTRLSLSHDPSHARFVPTDRIVNAARAGREYGLSTCVIGAFPSPDQELSRYAPELESIPGVRLVSTCIAPVGRASRRSPRPMTRDANPSLADMTCLRRVSHELVVFHDGSTWPCCSTFNRATAGLCIGNVRRDTLRTLWHRTEGSLLLRVMKRQGFARFYEIVAEYDPELRPGLPDASGIQDGCELCHRIFGSAELAGRVKQVFRRYERDRTLEAVDSLAEAIGPEATSRLLEEIFSGGVARPRATPSAPRLPSA